MIVIAISPMVYRIKLIIIVWRYLSENIPMMKEIAIHKRQTKRRIPVSFINDFAIGLLFKIKVLQIEMKVLVRAKRAKRKA